MAGRTNPPSGTIYRVVNLGTATIVENGIGDEDKARERLSREIGRVPGGRFAVEVRTSPTGEWLVVGTGWRLREVAASRMLAEPET